MQEDGHVLLAAVMAAEVALSADCSLLALKVRECGQACGRPSRGRGVYALPGLAALHACMHAHGQHMHGWYFYYPPPSLHHHRCACQGARAGASARGVPYRHCNASHCVV